ncbi:MAG: lysylphosphatidylglycerol synthase domain-containing protein, partial [Candidatus Atribacteria bacterium]|nr:lysylphosphatidylglycerol synthase domain-containing protein [Candidatus Atribacteria bacterium]
MYGKERYEPGRMRKQIVLSVFISLATCVFIFSIISFRGISIDLSAFHPVWLLVGSVLMTLAWMVDATRVFLTARAWNKEIRYRDALKTVLSGYFMSAITPSVTGGSPAQMYVLIRSGLSWGEAGSLVAVCGIL